MGDWDFLYEMRDRGYSEKDIADAAGCGYAPWDAKYVDRQWIKEQLDQTPQEEPQAIAPDTSFQSREGFPYSLLEQTEIFLDLIDCAQRHFRNTGRYLQLWGELGEIYAEIKFGLRRHSTHQAGSDGTISGKRVEVKTISPEKKGHEVYVKSHGNFEQLLIVRIDSDFRFQARLFDRGELRGKTGRFLRGKLRD